MVLEKMDDSIKLVIEGQMGIQRQLDEFKDETHAEFRAVEVNFKKVFGKLNEHDRKFEEVDTNFKKVFGKFSEHDSKFETAFEYLSRIDDEITEIKNKMAKTDWKEMSRSEFEGINRRLEKIENDLAKHKAMFLTKLKTA